jgi:predicted nucleic acid-binding Zn ribbon protein
MERAGHLIGKLKLSRDLVDPEERARAAWRMAAGKYAADHTRATSLVRGALIVEVEDIVWQRQLARLKPQLLGNLAQILGEALITDLDFRPMPRRIQPQPAVVSRPAGNPAEKVNDPVLDLLYQQSRRKQQA